MLSVLLSCNVFWLRFNILECNSVETMFSASQQLTECSKYAVVSFCDGDLIFRFPYRYFLRVPVLLAGDREGSCHWKRITPWKVTNGADPWRRGLTRHKSARRVAIREQWENLSKTFPRAPFEFGGKSVSHRAIRELCDWLTYIVKYNLQTRLGSQANTVIFYVKSK